MSLKDETNFNNPYVRDAILTVLFGALSSLLGMVQFQTPGFDGSYSDLREIALLISLFHISNPLFIIPLCTLTLIGIPVEAPMIPTFIMHVFPLFLAWYSFKALERRHYSILKSGMIWLSIAVIYYIVFIFPLLIITYQWVGIHTDKTFLNSYKSLLISSKFEMVATSLVSTLYLIQHEIRKSLVHTNKNLEEIVKQRTRELTFANSDLQTLNEELISSNEEVKSLNENLERLIKERTAKINDQLNQLTKYAHMNSHEVRAPLARMLGLLELLKRESNGHEQELLDKLYLSSEELDDVIKKMNLLLEKEITSQE